VTDRAAAAAAREGGRGASLARTTRRAASGEGISRESKGPRERHCEGLSTERPGSNPVNGAHWLPGPPGARRGLTDDARDAAPPRARARRRSCSAISMGMWFRPSCRSQACASMSVSTPARTCALCSRRRCSASESFRWRRQRS